MNQPTVALTRCSDYRQTTIAQAIKTQFELLGGLEKFVSRGDSVLLKPNFIAPKSRRCATQTDPAVIIETARLLKDHGARPFVADSPAWGNVFKCVEKLKLSEPLRKLSVPVRQLDKPRSCRLRNHNSTIGISSAALDADVIINLPKFKSHQQLVTTFAVKNMFGCVSGKRKALLHFTHGKNEFEFCRLLLDIFDFLRPAVTLIDAVTVMDGAGPITGTARPLGFLIGGTEPVACETVCARLVAIEPDSLPIIRTAKQMGFGCCDLQNIKIVGDGFAQAVCTDFQLPKPIPIRFSLAHVCKSVCKQILMLARPAR